MPVPLQGAEWSHAFVASLFEPVVWQGPETWGAPFATILIEFLELRCKNDRSDGPASRAAPEVGASHGAPTAAQQPQCSGAQEPKAGTCPQHGCDLTIHAPEDDRCFNTDTGVGGPTQAGLASTPQLTAAHLVPDFPPGHRATRSVSAACVEAQSCEAKQTAFCSANPPAIGLRAYLSRIGRYFGCSAVCLMYACAYVLRLESCGISLTPLTVHRLLGTAVVVAVKHVEDLQWTNAHYARVIGISLAELNSMELLMCSLLDFALWLPEPLDLLDKVRQTREMPKAAYMYMLVCLRLVLVSTQ